jgi:hypothetical protein
MHHCLRKQTYRCLLAWSLILPLALSAEVTTAQPSRLLSLLTYSLKWQQLQGMLPASVTQGGGQKFSLFLGTSAQSQTMEPETYPNALDKTIKVTLSTHA